MNLPGRIYAQQLPPIAFNPAQSRESIAAELRFQMLEAIRKSPPDAGSAISWSFRIKNILTIAALAFLQYYIYENPCKFVMHKLGISYGRLWLYLVSTSIMMTMCLYLFKVLLPKLGKAPAPRSPTKLTSPKMSKAKAKTKKAD